MASVAEEFSENVGFMSLLISWDDDRDRAIDVMESNNVPFITVNAENEELETLARMFEHRYIPQFVLIDGDGNVIENTVPRETEDYRTAILSALNG